MEQRGNIKELNENITVKNVLCFYYEDKYSTSLSYHCQTLTTFT